MSGQEEKRGPLVPGWTPEVAARLRDAVSRFGRQSDVAEKADLSRPSLVQILNGKSSPRRSTLEAICRVVGIEPSEITDPGIDSARVRGDVMRDSDTVEVVVSDVSYGLGGSYVDESALATSVELFPRVFIRQFTKGPLDQLYFAAGVGDSMEPTIHSSDLVLIDRSQRMLRVGDQIWAAAVGEICMVKRIRIGAGGEVLLVSDKAGVSDYSVAQDELQLIGRVVCVVKKL